MSKFFQSNPKADESECREYFEALLKECDAAERALCGRDVPARPLSAKSAFRQEGNIILAIDEMETHVAHLRSLNEQHLAELAKQQASNIPQPIATEEPQPVRTPSPDFSREMTSTELRAAVKAGKMSETEATQAIRAGKLKVRYERVYEGETAACLKAKGKPITINK